MRPLRAALVLALAAALAIEVAAAPAFAQQAEQARPGGRRPRQLLPMPEGPLAVPAPGAASPAPLGAPASVPPVAAPGAAPAAPPTPPLAGTATTPAPAAAVPGSAAPALVLPGPLALPGAAGSPATAIPEPEAGRPPSLLPPRPTPSILAEPLGGPDLDGVRALDPGQGGLPGQPWRDTPRAAAARLLAGLPAAPASPALVAAQRALLLSAAPAPSDAAEPALLPLRLAALVSTGDAAAALDLLERVPQGERERDALRRMAFRAQLLDGARDPACGLVRAALADGPPQPWWRQADLVCQLGRGEGEAAAVAARSLRGEGVGERAALDLAAALGLGRALRLPDPARMDWLEAALLASAPAGGEEASRLRLPAPSALDRAAPDVLRLLAQAPLLPSAYRLEAAWRAAAAGALPVEVLARQLLAERFTADEEATPAPLPPGRALALAYQQATRPEAVAAPEPAGRRAAGPRERRAEALLRAYQGAEGPRQAVLARLLAPEVERLGAPDAALAPLAVGLARLLLQAGRLERGLAFADAAFARARAAASPPPPVLALWPAAWLARAGEGEQDGAMREAWLAGLRRAGAEGAAAAAARRIADLAGLKVAAGDGEAATRLVHAAGGWLALAETGAAAAPAAAAAALPVALRRALAEAVAGAPGAEAPRPAEAAALAQIAAAAQPLASLSPDEIALIAAGLRAAGQAEAARGLVLDAALARGL